MDQLSMKSGGCPITRLTSGLKGEAELSPAARAGVFAYGLAAYAAFLATILYAIGFVGGFLVPKSIDTGPASGLVPSLLINTALLSVFVVQHTVMARPRFKRWWTRIVPEPIERSTFVLAASASLALVFLQWRPLPERIWTVDNAWLAGALTGVSMLGWVLVFASSFMVSHWDLFGLRQVFLCLKGKRYVPLGFRIVGLYRLVRHPLMLGFLIAVWAAPAMTVGHLFFAAMITAYILLGTTLEERDLMAHFGDSYAAYRRDVPGIIPRPGFLRTR